MARATTFLLMMMGLAPAHAPLAGLQVQGPAGGTLICAGRGGVRYAVEDLPDGAGGWLLVTDDPDADPINPPDGGTDTGILRLGSDLLPVPINDGPGGDDPCGALLVGGAGYQEPVTAMRLGPDRYLLAAFEQALDGPTPRRVFAWGFDAAGGATFAGEPFLSPGGFETTTRRPFAAPDGRGGFYLAWQEDPGYTSPVSDVFIIRYDGAGLPLWPSPVRLNLERTATTVLAIAADPAGGVWVAWLDRPRGGPVNAQPYLQRLLEDGTPILPQGGIRIDPRREQFGWGASMVAVPGGVVAAVAAGGVAVHFIGDHGGRAWGEEGRFFRPARFAYPPWTLRILRAPDGSLRLAWIEDPSAGEVLVATRLDLDGATPWPEPRELIGIGHALFGIDLEMLPDGALAAVGSLYGEDHSMASDVRGQVIDARGRLKAPAGGGVLCALPDYQSAPRILGADDRGIRVFWSDRRPGVMANGFGFATGAFTVTSNPWVAPVAAPIDLLQGATTMLVIDGDDLDPAADLAPGEGIRVVDSRVAPLSATGPGDRLTLTVQADPGAGLGTRALVVTNPDGESAATSAYLRILLDARRIDIDGSGRTDGYDLAVLASAFGRARGDEGYKPAADIDGSGMVDGVDLAFIASRFGGPPQ